MFGQEWVFLDKKITLGECTPYKHVCVLAKS